MEEGLGEVSETSRTGSREEKKIQLMDSIESEIVKGLTLKTYPSAEEIFRILEQVWQ